MSKTNSAKGNNVTGNRHKKSNRAQASRDTINPVHSVIRVNYALEFLKLFCDDGSGEGVPVEISVIPDFVIDFDRETLEKKIENREDPNLRERLINEIGGRAGRITRDLAFLRYQNDGTFRINFFCKTDEIGLALLCKKLQKEMEEKGYHPIDLSFVHKGPLARATLREGEKIIPSPVYPEHELCIDDLKVKGLDQIKRSTITMITSIRTPDFQRIFGEIYNPVDEKAVIIDTARTTEEEDWEKFFKIVRPKKLSPRRTRIAAIIIESSKEKEEIKKAYECLKKRKNSPFKDKPEEITTDSIAIDLQKWLDIPILFLEDRYVCWLDRDKKSIVPLPENVNIREIPDSPETFKAGFLLATAVKRALERWNDHHKQGTKKHINFTGISIEDTLVYASLLCGAWAKEVKLDKHPDRDTLVRFASEAKFHHNLPQGNLTAIIPSPPQETFWKLDSNSIFTKLHKNRNAMNLEDQLYLIDSIGYLESDLITAKIKDEVFEIINFPTSTMEETNNKCRELNKTHTYIPFSIAAIKAIKNLNNNSREKIIPSLLERAKEKEETKQIPTEKKERRIVLVDLDSSLMDSTNVRRLALFLALKELVPVASGNFNEFSQMEQKKLIEEYVNFYESYVYDKWPLYLYLSLGDFRQKWNLDVSYAVFLSLEKMKIKEDNKASRLWKLLDEIGPETSLESVEEIIIEYLFNIDMEFQSNLNNGTISKNLQQVFKDREHLLSESATVEVKEENRKWVINDEENKREYIVIKERNVLNIYRLEMEYLNKFVEDVKKIQIKCSRQITSACQEFEEAKFEPYKESFDFIDTLNNIGGFDVYIATEGVQETQLFKIHQTGLAEKISDHKVLSTGLVSEPEKDLQESEDSLRENEKLRNEKEKEYEKCEAQKKAIATATPEHGYPHKSEIDEYLDKIRCSYSKKLSKIETEKKGLENDNKMIKHFREIYKKFEKKEMKSFYALIAYAIDSNKERPLEFLKSFDNISLYKKERRIGERSHLKVAMIGDKHINDIEPLLRLFNGEKGGKRNILTIRMRTKKYMDKPEYGKGNYWPDYVVHTLEEAKCILLEEKTWDQVDYMPYPAILDFPIIDNEHRWDMLIWAFKQEQYLFAVTLAEQIIEENCADSNTARGLFNFLEKRFDELTYLSSTNSEDDFKEYSSPLRIAVQVAEHFLRMQKGEEGSHVYRSLCLELIERFELTFNHLSRLYINSFRSKANLIDGLQVLIVDGVKNLSGIDLIKDWCERVVASGQLRVGINTHDRLFKYTREGGV